MGNIVVVKREHITRREYFPVTDKELVLKSMVIYKPNESMYGRERPEDRELGAVGKILYEDLRKTVGIESFYLNPQSIKIALRVGYKWEDIEESILGVIKRALKWKEAKLIRYSEWIMDFGEEADRVFEDLEDEAELPNLQDRKKKQSGIIIDYTEERGRINFWPPVMIANGSGYFYPPIDQSKEEQRKDLDALGEKGKELVTKLLSISGVYRLEINPYYIEVTVSPAFSLKRAYTNALRIIKKLYNLVDEEKD